MDNTTRHSRYDSSGRVVGPSQKPEKTQHSEEADLNAPGGIQTRNPSKSATADPHLRLLGHWPRQNVVLAEIILQT